MRSFTGVWAFVACTLCAAQLNEATLDPDADGPICLQDKLERQIASSAQNRIEHGTLKYGCDVQSFPFKCVVRGKSQSLTWTDLPCDGIEVVTAQGSKMPCGQAYQYAVMSNIRRWVARGLQVAKSEYGCTLPTGTEITFTRHSKSKIVDASIKMSPKDTVHHLARGLGSFRGASSSSGSATDNTGGTSPLFMLGGIGVIGMYVWLKSVGRAPF